MYFGWYAIYILWYSLLVAGNILSSHNDRSFSRIVTPLGLDRALNSPHWYTNSQDNSRLTERGSVWSFLKGDTLQCKMQQSQAGGRAPADRLNRKQCDTALGNLLVHFPAIDEHTWERVLTFRGEQHIEAARADHTLPLLGQAGNCVVIVDFPQASVHKETRTWISRIHSGLQEILEGCVFRHQAGGQVEQDGMVLAISHAKDAKRYLGRRPRIPSIRPQGQAGTSGNHKPIYKSPSWAGLTPQGLLDRIDED